MRAAALHIMTLHLCIRGCAGMDTEGQGSGEAEQQEVAAAAGDDDGSQVPAWPKYDGLAYASAAKLPCSVADVPFPPPAAPLAAI